MLWALYYIFLSSGKSRREKDLPKNPSPQPWLKIYNIKLSYDNSKWRLLWKIADWSEKS